MLHIDLSDRQRAAIIHAADHVKKNGRHIPTSCPYPSRGMCPYYREIMELKDMGIGVPE